MTLAEDKDLDNSTTPSYAPSVQKEYKVNSDDSSATEKEDGSTRGTSPAAGELQQTTDAEVDDGSYPSGFKMAAIVVALVLSIFLVSVIQDIARCDSANFTIGLFGSYYCWNSYSSYHC